MYDGAMARLMIEALPAAAVLHILVAIWQFSEPGVLYSPPLFGTNTGDPVSQLAGEDVTNSVGSFLFTASHNDASGLNIVARLSRENTLPLFVLLAAFLAAWLLYRTAGVALAALVRQCCYVCSRGRWCHERPGVREELAFNPPFCGPFALPLDPKVTHKLTPFEERTGWKIVKDTASGLPGKPSSVVAGVLCLATATTRHCALPALQSKCASGGVTASPSASCTAKALACSRGRRWRCLESRPTTSQQTRESSGSVFRRISCLAPFSS